MNHSIAKLVFVISVTVATSFAQRLEANQGEREFGIGFIVFAPTGLSIRQELDPQSALHGALSYFLGDFLVAQGDYVLKYPGLIPVEPEYGSVAPYFGLGLRADFGHDSFFHALFVPGDVERSPFSLGGRMPMGIQYRIPVVPFEIFAEITPMLFLLPDTYFALSFGTGVLFNL